MWSELPPLTSSYQSPALKWRKVQWENVLLAAHSAVRVQGHLLCSPAPCPLGGSSALQDTPGWHRGGAGLQGRGVHGGRQGLGAAAHSGCSSWKPQTKTR